MTIWIFRLNLPTVKRLCKIYAWFHALVLVAAVFCLTGSDSFTASAVACRPDAAVQEPFPGVLIPAAHHGDGRHDTGNIYADTPQIAVPRNTTVSGSPRQQSTAKRTSAPVAPDTTFKDGKVISRSTIFTFISYIGLFPSGLWKEKTRLLSFRKLII